MPRPRLTSEDRRHLHQIRMQERRAARTERAPAVVEAVKVHEPFIGLGCAPDGSVVTLPVRALLRHAWMLGTTGAGKSNAALALLRQLIALGVTVVVLDPNGLKAGGLYREGLAWLEESGLARLLADTGRLHVIDPNVINFTTALNPAHRDSDEVAVSVQADAMLAAFSATRGDEDQLAKPTARRAMKGLFHAIIDGRLTLLEAEQILDPDLGGELRRHLLETLSDPFALNFLRRLERLAGDQRLRREFEIETIAPLNRLSEFLASKSLRRAFGQSTRSLSFVELLDSPGALLLCNLEDGLQASAANTDLLGRLVLNSIVLAMKRRRTKHPVIIVCDEGHRFVGYDADDLLTMARGYAVGFLLLHQDMSQLMRPGDDRLLKAVRTKCATKVAFRIEDIEEATLVARNMCPLDLEQPVRALIKPAAIGQEVMRFKSESTSTHTAETIATAISQTLSETEAEGFGTASADMTAMGSGTMAGAHTGTAITMPGSSIMTMLPPGIFNMPNSVASQSGNSSGTNSFSSSARSSASMHSISRAITTTLAESISRALTSGRSVSEGFSEGLRTIYRDLPTAIHSLENVAHMAAREIKLMPTGTALVTHGGLFAKISVPHLPHHPDSDRLLQQARERAFRSSYASLSAEQADAAIIQRAQALRSVFLGAACPPTSDADFSVPEPLPGDAPDRDRLAGIIERAQAAAASSGTVPLGSPPPTPTKSPRPSLAIDNDARATSPPSTGAICDQEVQ